MSEIIIIIAVNSQRGIGKVRALCDKYFNFGMVLGMVIRFSKTIANKLGSSPSGLFAINQISDASVVVKNPIN